MEDGALIQSSVKKKRPTNEEVAFTEEGYPACKIRHGKFITLSLVDPLDQRYLNFIIGEWTPSTTGGWEKTANTISLNLHQYNRLGY